MRGVQPHLSHCLNKEETMEEIKLYRLKDGNGYTKVGTDEELISYHNDYVINSNNFKENEIKDAMAKVLTDLDEYWDVEHFYTVPLYAIVENSPRYKERIHTIEQLWQCIQNGYTYSESQIHMKAFLDGKTTAKKLVVIDKESV